MKREIKFRGKRIADGEWEYGGYTKLIQGGEFINPINPFTHNVYSVEVDGSTVGNFTGIRDRHGKKIYLDDVVEYANIKYTDCSRIEIEDILDSEVGVIYYAEGVWLGMKRKDESGIIFRPGQFYLENSVLELKVIGNIHDNPELLEEENK